MKNIVLVMLMAINVGVAFSEPSPGNPQSVESIRAKHLQMFEEIQEAFDAGDNKKVEELLDSLKLGSPHTSNDKLNQFHSYLSLGNLTDAKELAYALLDDSELSDADRARIHEALGYAYLQIDKLDEAVSEFKEILELYEKQNSIDR
jgi:tetratricopeptide (TPR) repeat protein